MESARDPFAGPVGTIHVVDGGSGVDFAVKGFCRLAEPEEVRACCHLGPLRCPFANDIGWTVKPEDVEEVQEFVVTRCSP